MNGPPLFALPDSPARQMCEDHTESTRIVTLTSPQLPLKTVVYRFISRQTGTGHAGTLPSSYQCPPSRGVLYVISNQSGLHIYKSYA